MPLQHHAVRRISRLRQTHHLERERWLSYIRINGAKEDNGEDSCFLSEGKTVRDDVGRSKLADAPCTMLEGVQRKARTRKKVTIHDYTRQR